MKPISDARTCKDGCTYLRGGLHVLARTDARTCGDGCTYLQGRIFSPQTFTMTDANVCKDGCKRLQGRLQTFASEKGKTGAEIVSPVLDKKKAALGPQWFPLTGGSFAPVLWRTALQAAISD